MPVYKVILTRDITESTVATITAPNHHKAEEIALELAASAVPPSAWEIDDNLPQDAYVTDVSEVFEYEVAIVDATDVYAVKHVPTDTIVDGRFDDGENAQMWADKLNGK